MKASAAERRALAELLHLPAIEALEASLQVSRFGTDGLEVKGQIDAHVTQTCVVTGEEFATGIVAPVDIRFSPDGVDPNAPLDPDELLDLEAEDPPDLLVDGRIDLGAIVGEFLALALDPYPRKPGASFETSEDAAIASPFSGLTALRKEE